MSSFIVSCNRIQNITRKERIISHTIKNYFRWFKRRNFEIWEGKNGNLNRKSGNDNELEGGI